MKWTERSSDFFVVVVVVSLLSHVVSGSSGNEEEEEEEEGERHWGALRRGSHMEGDSSHGEDVYLNKWAVEVEGGSEMADDVARQNGFRNLGQVRWVEQQKVKRRVKRDFQTSPALMVGDTTVLVSVMANENVSETTPKTTTASVPWNPILNDPLWTKMWYMHGSSPNWYGMNVVGAWERGYTGKGVVVTILDDGIEHNHTDLHYNYDPEASYDLNSMDKDPTPRYDNADENRHGTRCAGEVAAVANNKKCAVGVAFNANIGGVRMLDGDVSDYVEAKALSLNLQHIDIYSASWGPEDNGKVVDGPARLAREAFSQGIMRGRGGKGSIYIWASGNGGSQSDSCSCDGYTNSIFTLSVSSTSEHGTRPWYLEECASTLATTYSSGENYRERKIMTTDLRNRCTDNHTGTSASAPLAAGICALALEANRNLTWRDMQHIVIGTAITEPLRDAMWVTNGVGRKVSHRYGYGLMNALAMVKMAERWTTVPEQHICASTLVKVDRPWQGDGLSFTINTDGCENTSNVVNYLEHVQAKVSLTYSRRGDLQIHLVSPNGTRSTLLPKRKNDYHMGEFRNWSFLSVFYWGESPNGNWTLELENVGFEHNFGLFEHWQLMLYGTATEPINLIDPPTRLFTNQNLSRIFDRVPRYENRTAPSPKSTTTITTPTIPIVAHASVDNADNYTTLINKSTTALSDDFTVAVGRLTAVSGLDVTVTAADFSTDATVVSAYGHNVQGFVLNSTTDYNLYRTNDNAATANVTLSSELTQSSHSSETLTTSVVIIGGRNLSAGLTEAPNILDFPSAQNESIYNDTRTTFVNIINDSSTVTSINPSLSVMNATTSVTLLPLLPATTSNEDEFNCDSECSAEGCSGPLPEDCFSCKHVQHPATGHCISSCPIGMYLQPSTNQCEPCVIPCSTCSLVEMAPAVHVVSCESCAPEHFLLELGNLTVCTDQCPDHYYGDLSDSRCLMCRPECLECFDSSSDCHQCSDGYELISRQCLPACLINEFRDNHGSCRRCDVSCDICTGPSARDCVTCAENWLWQDDVCVAGCSEGYYADSGMEDERICKMCHPACSTCSGETEYDCYSCYHPLSLVGSTCQERCPTGHYDDEDGLCHSCNSSCETCRGPQESDCLTCAAPFYFFEGRCVAVCGDGLFYVEVDHMTGQVTRSCDRCHATCHTCVGLSRHDCITCRRGLLLHGGDDGECTMSCHSNEYKEDETRCVRCHDSCQSCVGQHANQCLACHADGHLYDGWCLSQCPPGYYAHRNRCDNCDPACQTCNGSGSAHCLLCSNGFEMSVDGSCFPISDTPCIEHEFYNETDSTCYACDDSCLTCTGTRSDQCTSCELPLLLFDAEHRCLVCCGHSITENCCLCESKEPETNICFKLLTFSRNDTIATSSPSTFDANITASSNSTGMNNINLVNERSRITTSSLLSTEQTIEDLTTLPSSAALYLTSTDLNDSKDSLSRSTEPVSNNYSLLPHASASDRHVSSVGLTTQMTSTQTVATSSSLSDDSQRTTSVPFNINSIFETVFTYAVSNPSTPHSSTASSSMQTSRKHSFTSEPQVRFFGAPLWLFLLVIFVCLVIILAAVIIVVVCLHHAKSNNKLCWSKKHRYHAVPLFYLNNRNKPATNGKPPPPSIAAGDVEMHIRV